MPEHSALITEGQREDVSEKYLLSEEFLSWFRLSRAWGTLSTLKSVPVSVDLLTVFRNLNLKRLTEDFEFLESHRLVEQSPKGWYFTDTGRKVMEKIREIEARERAAPEMRDKKRRLNASVIGSVIVLGVLWVIFEIIEALGGAIEQHFGGVFGSILSILIWIPGLFGIICVLLFFRRLLTRLGLRGLDLF